MIVRCSIVACLLLVQGSFAGSEEQHSSSSSLITPFEFHSNFWINLHHFLYQQALQKANHSRGSVSVERQLLSASERETWDKAIAFYQKTMVSHDLLFDSTMQNVDTALGDAEGIESLSSASVDGALRTQLEAAATVYRDHWWGLHNQANQFWISAVGPLVRQFGPSLVSQISQAYETKWPSNSVRVDVTEYANWAGAYTFGKDRVHTLVSSFDPSNQGFAALEVLFHEATHGIVDENIGRLADRIAADCKLNNLVVPEDLWHAVIFFTAGELVRRSLGTVGVQNYEPYADKNGLYVRAGWTRYESALQLFWIPHLNATLSLDEAVSKIIAALAVADNHSH